MSRSVIRPPGGGVVSVMRWARAQETGRPILPAAGGPGNRREHLAGHGPRGRRWCRLPSDAGGFLLDKSVIILVVSREILEGSVVDRNAAFIANRIDDLGYRVRTIQVVDRVESEMVAALRWAFEQWPKFVIMTGGIGPNWDDNTRACLAKATNLPLKEDKRALEQIKNAYRRMNAKGLIREVELTEARAGMARVPEGSICHENTVGT